MNEENKVEEAVEVEEKSVETPEAPKMRQIIIETDGDNIHLVKSETAGKIELAAIMQMVADSIRGNSK